MRRLEATELNSLTDLSRDQVSSRRPHARLDGARSGFRKRVGIRLCSATQFRSGRWPPRRVSVMSSWLGLNAMRRYRHGVRANGLLS